MTEIDSREAFDKMASDWARDYDRTEKAEAELAEARSALLKATSEVPRLIAELAAAEEKGRSEERERSSATLKELAARIRAGEQRVVNETQRPHSAHSLNLRFLADEIDALASLDTDQEGS